MASSIFLASEGRFSGSMISSWRGRCAGSSSRRGCFFDSALERVQVISSTGFSLDSIGGSSKRLPVARSLADLNRSLLAPKISR